MTACEEEEMDGLRGENSGSGGADGRSRGKDGAVIGLEVGLDRRSLVGVELTSI